MQFPLFELSAYCPWENAMCQQHVTGNFKADLNISYSAINRKNFAANRRQIYFLKFHLKESNCLATLIFDSFSLNTKFQDPLMERHACSHLTVIVFLLTHK